MKEIEKPQEENLETKNFLNKIQSFGIVKATNDPFAVWFERFKTAYNKVLKNGYSPGIEWRQDDYCSNPKCYAPRLFVFKTQDIEGQFCASCGYFILTTTNLKFNSKYVFRIDPTDIKEHDHAEGKEPNMKSNAKKSTPLSQKRVPC